MFTLYAITPNNARDVLADNAFENDVYIKICKHSEKSLDLSVATTITEIARGNCNWMTPSEASSLIHTYFKDQD